MTPKEKAEELIETFYYPTLKWALIHAKECALKATDEVLKELSPLEQHPLGTYTNPKIEYWQEVKQEIENYNKNEGDSKI